jgi:hypothetical protein
MLARIVFAFLFSGPAYCAAAQTPSIANSIPIVSVCEALQNLGLYNNKSIILVGKIANSFEGAWLTDSCEQKIVTDGYVWGNGISTTVWFGRADPAPSLPNKFIWDDRALMKKIKALKGYKDFHNINMWAAIYGRLETRIPPQVFRDSDGRVRGLGYGHLGDSIAQLVSDSDGFHQLKEEEPRLIPDSEDFLDQPN